MKTLKDYIIESQNFLVNKKLNNRQDKYEYHPTNRDELKDIIIDLLKQGETDLNCIDVTKIDSMSFLFYFVTKKVTVKEIDLSEWDVSKVTDMGGMFSGCEKFNSDLSRWDVSNVINMANMFARCKEFSSDLSKWDVSKVTDMTNLFHECKKFNSDLSKWNVSKIKSMYGMFDGCENFNSDLSDWNVPGVTDMRRAFTDCTTLKKNNKIPDWYK